MRVFLIRFLISLLVWVIGGPKAWRCFYRCVAARDWAALDYYTDVVWMDWSWLSAKPGLRSRYIAPMVRWLAARLPEPAYEDRPPCF